MGSATSPRPCGRTPPGDPTSGGPVAGRGDPSPRSVPHPRDHEGTGTDGSRNPSVRRCVNCPKRRTASRWVAGSPRDRQFVASSPGEDSEIVQSEGSWKATELPIPVGSPRTIAPQSVLKASSISPGLRRSRPASHNCVRSPAWMSSRSPAALNRTAPLERAGQAEQGQEPAALHVVDPGRRFRPRGDEEPAAGPERPGVARRPTLADRDPRLLSRSRNSDRPHRSQRCTGRRGRGPKISISRNWEFTASSSFRLVVSQTRTPLPDPAADDAGVVGGEDGRVELPERAGLEPTPLTCFPRIDLDIGLTPSCAGPEIP